MRESFAVLHISYGLFSSFFSGNVGGSCMGSKGNMGRQMDFSSNAREREREREKRKELLKVGACGRGRAISRLFFFFFFYFSITIPNLPVHSILPLFFLNKEKKQQQTNKKKIVFLIIVDEHKIWRNPFFFDAILVSCSTNSRQ